MAMYVETPPRPSFLRRRVGRVFENLFAAFIGAIVVGFAQGMTPTDMLNFAVANINELPEFVRGVVAQTFVGAL